MITLAVVMRESKTNVTIKMRGVLAKTMPAKTTMGIQANMKNLYISQSQGVSNRKFGIKTSSRKVILRYSWPGLIKEIIARNERDSKV